MRTTPGFLGQPVKRFTAQDILSLLAEKHAKDVFVPECKDGPSWSGKFFRLDAWAMRRSWSNPMVTGYEIKVSRADYLKDDKWQAYLECCNSLYFVCPSGLINPEEVPGACGLLWVSSTGKHLTSKKKADYNPHPIPEPVYRYILMSRAKIVKPHQEFQQSTIDYWRQWIKEKEESRSIGGMCRVALANQLHGLKRENDRLQKLINAYDRLRIRLKDLGIDPDNEWTVEWSAADKIKAINAVFSESFDYNLEHLAKQIASMQAELKRQREKLTEQVAPCSGHPPTGSPLPP